MVGAISLLPPQLRPAASRPPAPTALAQPRWRRRLLRAPARGRRRRRRRLPRRVLPPPPPSSSLPGPAAPSPSPARLRRLHPLRSVTLGDSALATFAALAPAHARPSDAEPGVGRRGPGAGVAVAGARARPLPAAPSAKSGGRPIHTAAGRNQVGAREGAAPVSPALGEKREREGGKRRRREGGDAASGLLSSC